MKIIDYTLNSIDNIKYNITFTFEDGTKSTQNITFGEFKTKSDLDAAIMNYTLAYIQGLDTKPAVIPLEITAIIGKKQTVAIEMINVSKDVVIM